MTEVDDQRVRYIGICVAKDSIQMSNHNAGHMLRDGLRTMNLESGWWTPVGEIFWETRKKMRKRDRCDKRDK
jgi:hypothetical protein